MTRQSEFIEKIAPYAQEVQNKHGIPASLVIAQAALESGWGSSAKGNNFFGIKAAGKWNGPSTNVATHEYENGQRIGITDSFRAYGGLADSVANYGKFLAENRRYKHVLTANNAYDAAEEIQRAGYATDPKYATMLKDIIRSNELTRFDDKKYQGYTQSDEKFGKFLEKLFSSIFEIIGSIFRSEKNLVKADVGKVDQNSIFAPALRGKSNTPAIG
jgi:peptidoglycan hydrolase FlgJ